MQTPPFTAIALYKSQMDINTMMWVVGGAGGVSGNHYLLLSWAHIQGLST